MTYYNLPRWYDIPMSQPYPMSRSHGKTEQKRHRFSVEIEDLPLLQASCAILPDRHRLCGTLGSPGELVGWLEA